MKKLLVSLASIAWIVMPGAYAEDVKVSTYYPSPYGSYQDLEVTQNAFLGSQSGGKVGVGIANGTTIARALQVKGGSAGNHVASFENTSNNMSVAVGSPNETNAAGSIQAFNASSSAAVPLVINPSGGAVGVGNSAPSASYKMDITGDVRVSGNLFMTISGTTARLRVTSVTSGGTTYWYSYAVYE